MVHSKNWRFEFVHNGLPLLCPVGRLGLSQRVGFRGLLVVFFVRLRLLTHVVLRFTTFFLRWWSFVRIVDFGLLCFKLEFEAVARVADKDQQAALLLDEAHERKRLHCFFCLFILS